MPGREVSPSPGAIEAVRRLAGPLAAIRFVARLEGGQHSDTWRVDTENPAISVVVRQFPVGDDAAACEQRILRLLDGLGGLSPVLLGADLDGQWSEHPTSLISWLDGHANVTPSDPRGWAAQLGHALAAVHNVPIKRLKGWPSVFDGRGSQDLLSGPLATEVRSRWAEIVESPMVLTHSDYWSGNVVWRDDSLTGIVDWSGAARGPRGYDVGWCRLDLVLLFGVNIADEFLSAYERATGETLRDTALWDSWAVARSHDNVVTWVPNYAPLGRPDLTEHELRSRHSLWTAHLRSQAGA